MAMVPLKLWVTANFKEADISHMRPDQPATIMIDACSDAKVKRHIECGPAAPWVQA